MMHGRNVTLRTVVPAGSIISFCSCLDIRAEERRAEFLPFVEAVGDCLSDDRFTGTSRPVQPEDLTFSIPFQRLIVTRLETFALEINCLSCKEFPCVFGA